MEEPDLSSEDSLPSAKKRKPAAGTRKGSPSPSPPIKPQDDVSSEPDHDKSKGPPNPKKRKKEPLPSKDGKGPAICEECGMTLKNNFLLNAHKRRVHNPNRREFECPESDCLQKFKQGRSLWMHYYRQHMNQSQLPLDVQQLIIGSARKRGGGGVRAKRCGEGAAPPSTICGVCGKVFKDTNSMRRHLVKQHEAPGVRYPCPDCGKGYKTKDWMEAHRKKEHLGEMVTRCQICDKEQASEGKLWKHRVEEHGMGGEEAAEGLGEKVKWQQCGECGELLLIGKMWGGHLRERHKGGDQWREWVEGEKERENERRKLKKREARRRVREGGDGPEWLKKEKEMVGKKQGGGDKGYCAICEVVVNDGLKQHMRLSHGGGGGRKRVAEGGWKCGKEGCGKEFSVRDNLVKHVIEVHCELEERIVGSKIFKVEECQGREGEWNSYECTLCGGRFGHRAEVRIHVVREHPEVYRSIVEGTEVRMGRGCPMKGCGEEMEGGEEEVRRHLEERHGDKCWRCPECDRVMLSPEEMEVHWRREHGGDGEEVEKEEKEGVWMWRRERGGWSKGKGEEARTEYMRRLKEVTGKYSRMRGSCEICGVELSLVCYGGHLRNCHRVEEREEWGCESCGKVIRRRENWLVHMERKHGGEVDMEVMLKRGWKMNVEGGVEGLGEIHQKKWRNGRLMKRYVETYVVKKREKRIRKKGRTVSKIVKQMKPFKLSGKLEEKKRNLEKEKRLVIGPLKRVKAVQKEILYLDVNS